jgi:hypothetical protein
VRLWLSVIAYNLGSLLRPVQAKGIAMWSLASLQQRLVKRDGRMIKHARYCWLLLRESQLTRHLFGSMLRAHRSSPAASRAGAEGRRK